MKNLPIILFIFILFFVIVSGCAKVASTPQVTPTKSPSQLIQEIDDSKALMTSQAIDYTNPLTRDFAVGLVKKSSSGNYNINQICDIWEYGYNKWVYVNDPLGQDYYSPASRTISLGLKGDCDDFAVLNAAVIQSIGGSSRVVTACNVEGCHAYAEVYINEADLQSVTNDIGSRYGVKTVYYQRSVVSKGVPSYWLNLDWWATNPGGEFFQDNGMKHIFYSDGSHYVSTNSGETIISKTVTPTVAPTFNFIYVPTPTVAPTFNFIYVPTPTVAPTFNFIYVPTPAPTPTIDWSFKLVTPTPTPTVEYDWSFKLKK